MSRIRSISRNRGFSREKREVNFSRTCRHDPLGRAKWISAGTVQLLISWTTGQRKQFVSRSRSRSWPRTSVRDRSTAISYLSYARNRDNASFIRSFCRSIINASGEVNWISNLGEVKGRVNLVRIRQCRKSSGLSSSNSSTFTLKSREGEREGQVGKTCMREREKTTLCFSRSLRREINI